MKVLNILKDKKGDGGLSLVIKVVISCVLGAIVLTFAYFVIENSFVNNTVSRQNSVYNTEVVTEKQEQTNGFEIVHSTIGSDD